MANKGQESNKGKANKPKLSTAEKKAKKELKRKSKQGK